MTLLDLTVIVPLLNEEESLPELAAWIDRVAQANQYQYEVIFVDDGSTDTSWQVIQDLANQNPNIKGIKFQRNYGKSAALNEGFAAAQGKVVVTMDADLQDSPEEIPEFIHMINVEGYNMVSGWKRKRFDNRLTKNLPSKFFNGVTSKVSGIKLHDFNCGLKAYDNKVIKNVEVYGEMHRYIPVLAKNAGFKRIGEKVVQHQARKYGVSKFGWNRFVNGFLDLLTVQFVGKFGKKPMHFFGLFGALIFLAGFSFILYLVICKFIWWDTYSVYTRPPFYMALTLILMGTMFFLAGFLAELMVRNAPERNQYAIDEKLRL